MLVLVTSFWFAGQRRLSVFTLAIAFAAATPWVLQLLIHYVSGVAVPEFVSGLAGAVWTEILSIKMLKEASRAKTS
jgi:hypothetical membrane protein